MMKSSYLPAAILAVALAGCGGAPSDGGPQPGQYQETTKVTTLEFTGMTPELKQQTIAQMERATSGQNGGLFCLGKTDDQDWKSASESFSRGLGGTCTKLKNEGSATAIDAEMSCKGTSKGDATIKINGTANSDSYSVTAMMDFFIPETKETAKLGYKVSAKRVGDCPGS